MTVEQIGSNEGADSIVKEDDTVTLSCSAELLDFTHTYNF